MCAVQIRSRTVFVVHRKGPDEGVCSWSSRTCCAGKHRQVARRHSATGRASIRVPSSVRRPTTHRAASRGAIHQPLPVAFHEDQGAANRRLTRQGGRQSGNDVENRGVGPHVSQGHHLDAQLHLGVLAKNRLNFSINAARPSKCSPCRLTDSPLGVQKAASALQSPLLKAAM